MDQATLKLRVAELSRALASAQIALAEAQSEAAKKDTEISKLRSDFRRKNEDLIEEQGYLFAKDETGNREAVPIVHAVWIGASI